jgi:nitroimidazol reductase NimA-like FMN-containing flavoprotein (pyridoxamine 5'-phosphate oxidase superfamily)
MKLLHGSPGFGVQLSENEIKKFLSESKLNLHLGTVDPDDYPNIHPTWYIYDDSKDVIFVETGKQSKKTSNLNKNDKIYFCVDDGNPPYKGIRGKGNVRILSDPDANLPIVEKIMLKYLGSTTHPMAKILLENVRNGDSVILEIKPKYYSTWDYSRNS